MYDLLNTIDAPATLRQLEHKDLHRLTEELRAFLIESVSKTGGHLSSNLGSVELTIALHYIFDTPHDRIVWDVGHQCYGHKVLTGRRQAMSTLRQYGGISGFPRRDESQFDTFGTAHSSTSISAALGMAHGARCKQEKRHTVAVIGDGALTAGLSFEAMNNINADKSLPLLVILNDNDMSISPPVGALSHYLEKLNSGRFYSYAQKSTTQALSSTPTLHTLFHSLEKQPIGLFEDLGFNYTGPIDGHDLDVLIHALQYMRTLQGPQLLHIVTQKGYGYSLAEANPVLYHGPGKFDPAEGITPIKDDRKTYTQVFGEWLCDEAEHDPRVIAITPAMREGSGLVEYERRFPERYFDVGIAEQHAVTFAAGLATEGLKPVVAIYSTFLQRAYDQLIHDVALQKLPVIFAIDRAGVVGADGATHMGAYDLAFMRCLPNMIVMVPSDENECRQMLHTALQQNGPAAVRYPRGTGTGVTPLKTLTTLELGKGEVRRSTSLPAGHRIAILAFGSMLAPALAAAEVLDATVANMRFVKPLDDDLVSTLAKNHDMLVTIEEGCLMGGAGSACLESLATANIARPVLRLGFADHFIEHGDTSILLRDCGLDAHGIALSVQCWMQSYKPPAVDQISSNAH